DRRAVRRADVVPLAVEGGRVVHAEEPAEELLVAELCGIEDRPDRLGVAGIAVLDVVVGRILRRAAGVADAGLEHAGDLPDELLHAPEASARERRGLALPGLLRRPVGLVEERPVRAVTLLLELVDGDEAERRGVDAV